MKKYDLKNLKRVTIRKLNDKKNEEFSKRRKTK
jgi:vacuolar-type H+-ATPase subunit C/Vma6